MQYTPLIFVFSFVLAGCEANGNPLDDGPAVEGQAGVEEAFPNLTFQRPVGVYAAPDGTARLFVVEQAGVVRVFDDDPTTTETRVFLDVRDRVNDRGNEEGLLGLAFHPQFSSNGRFFLDYTASGPRRTVVSEFSLDGSDPDRADPGSERIVLEVDQPYSNHNGGQIAFGPDGFLYLGMGDGGSGGDPLGNGQDRTTLLGSILRIDVDNPSPGKAYGIPPDNPYEGGAQGFREEIFAYGLRNPWRFSFDPASGALWAGDVGQNRIEEIDLIEAGGNYGWNVMEGSSCYNPSSGCDRAGLILPVAEYGHDQGISVTGGYVYRGSRMPALEGRYVYGDFGSGRIWALLPDSPSEPATEELLRSGLAIASFGLDRSGEILICAFDGKIYRLTVGS